MSFSPLFNPAILRQITKHLIPRARTRVPFNRTGMTAEEAEMFKERSKLKASVLIPLCNYKNKASILYTQRTDKVSTHRGQISFPGGHADHTDQSLLHSALREFHEECGVHFKFSIDDPEIDKQFNVSSSNENGLIAAQPFLSDSNEPGVNAFDIQILGTLFDSVPSKHGTSVQPIVGFLKPSKYHEIVKKSDLIGLLDPHPDEVNQVFCVPVDELTNPHFQKTDEFNRRGSAIRFTPPSSPAGDIWGLTGYLTQQLINHVLLPSLRDVRR